MNNDNWQGMNWIRKCKRLALYLLFGMQCAYCQKHVDQVDRLTIDHLIARECGGDNHQTNLVPACNYCNASKGKKDWKSFVQTVDLPEGVSPQDVINLIEEKRKEKLDRKKAKQILAEAPDWKTAMTFASQM